MDYRVIDIKSSGAKAMKVFLSSTYIDLIEYRQAAKEALERLGQQVGGMEIFGARDEEPKNVSLAELEKCEIVIGIYAYRYGFISEGDEISITEQEYLNARNKGKAVLCFVVSEDQPWLPKFIENNPEKLKKLEDFKAEILKGKTVDFFTTPADLGMKVATSIHNYLEHHKPKGNTLPAQPFFFGRETELAAIADAISPESRTWGALIYGEGGIGKTALAIEAAHHALSNLFEVKIFISAKERELTSKGEVSSKDFSHNDFFSILNELALQLGEEGIPRLAQEERANTLKNTLATKKTLIVLDNLETLDPDDRNHIYQFLAHLPQGNKEIVTCRLRDETDARTIRLDELSKTEAEKLISELAKRNPRLQDISDKEKGELYQVANGNPLMIRWIVGQVGRDGSSIKTVSEAIYFIRQAPDGNDPLEYVFGDLLASSNLSEKNVLALMTYLNHAPKAEWISKITGHKEYEIELIWNNLVSRSILSLNKSNKEYFLPDLTKQFIQKKLHNEINVIEEKLAKYAFRMALEFGGLKNHNGLIKLEESWPVISKSFPYFLKHDDNDLQILCDALDMFLKYSGLRDEWLWLNQQAEVTAQGNYDFDSAGDRAYKVGLIYSYLEMPNEVLQYATRTEKYWQEIKTTKLSLKGKTLVSHLRGISYKLSGNYPKAAEFISEALGSWNKTDTDGMKIRAVLLNTLGEIQVKEGELGNAKEKFGDAEKNFEEAILIASQSEQKEEIAIYKGNLADLTLKKGNLVDSNLKPEHWQKAITLANDALKLGEELGYQEEIARENLHLAIAYLNLGDGKPRGLSTSKKAVEIYKRLRHKALPGAEAILMEWER